MHIGRGHLSGMDHLFLTFDADFNFASMIVPGPILMPLDFR